MRISFDIDDTIISYRKGVPQEPNQVPWLLRYWFDETLRLGTKELMKNLIKEGWEIAIYTTSYRSPYYLKRLFKFYGINIGLIVNQDIHDTMVKQHSYQYSPSKFPSKFQIDLHVDDSEGVLMEGQKYGFEVTVVNPNDLDWINIVLSEASKIKDKVCKM